MVLVYNTPSKKCIFCTFNRKLSVTYTHTHTWIASCNAYAMEKQIVINAIHTENKVLYMTLQEETFWNNGITVSSKQNKTLLLSTNQSEL